MTKPAAIQADFTSYRPVPSRKVLQLVFEVPLEQQAHTFDVLGYPQPEQSTWVAVALLNLQTATPQVGTSAKVGSETKLTRTQMAGMKIKELSFQMWLGVHPQVASTNKVMHADTLLKQHLGIKSKKEIVDGPIGEAFDRLLASYDAETRYGVRT